MGEIETIVVWIGFALICYALAEKKGKNKVVALGVGLLTGLIGVIYYLLANGSREYQIKQAEDKLRKLRA